MNNRKHLQAAKQAIHQGDHACAHRYLHQYIAQYPGDFEGWLLLGGLLKPEDGYKYIQKAHQLSPENDFVMKAVLWIEDKLSHQKMRQTHQDTIKQPIETTPSTTLDQTKPILLKWVAQGLLILLLLLLAALFTVGLYSFIQGTEPTILGHQVIIVTSGSMEPVFETGSIILINTRTNNRVFSEGDIVMFRSPENPQTNITHRVIDVIDEDDTVSYRTKGDNNDYEDQLPITNQDIVGEYMNFTIPRLGYFFSFIRTRNGLITLAMLFGFYLVISQAVKIKQYLSESKA